MSPCRIKVRGVQAVGERPENDINLLVFLIFVAGGLNVRLLGRLLRLFGLDDSFGLGGCTTSVLRVFDSMTHGLELKTDLGDRVHERLVLWQ